MSLSTVVLAASETAEHSEPAINPYVVGGIALGILLLMLLVTLSFGAGREHS
ncbi:hypothetical protein [Nocardioides speluncae]|uniref:hypothetical protein n=1 Tax=Nocardioides speluncae TaxID=2670337 RepID=UPI001473CA87|nr:hypothetical protein [Nocardioides speluncae]